MKKNYILSAIALCACLLSSCNKEMDTPQSEASEENKEGVITYIRATGNENASKGSIDGESGSFSWNVGDQIAVWNTVGESAGYNVSAALTSEDFSGDNATFIFTDLGERSNYAVSPAWIRVAGNPTSVTLPGTYTLAQVAGEKSPVPMIAVNSNEGTLHFKQLGALLRITLNNLPPSTRSVTIDFNGKKVQGTFAVSNPGTATPSIATEAASDGNDVITINIPAHEEEWLDNQVVNIPVPTGTYTTITVKSLDVEGKCTLQMTRWIKVASGISSNWKPIRTSARKVIASLPAFSVNSTDRVAFAPGNLYKDKDTGDWKFFSEQYGMTFYDRTTSFVEDYYTTKGYTEEDESDLTKRYAAKEDEMTKFLNNYNRDLFLWSEVTTTSTGKAGPNYSGESTIFNSTSFGTLKDKDGVNRSDWKLCPDFEYMLLPLKADGTPVNGHSHRSGARFARVLLMSDCGFPNCSLFGNIQSTHDMHQCQGKLGGTSGIFVFPDHWDEEMLTSSMSKTTNYNNPYFQGVAEGIWLITGTENRLESKEISRVVYDQLIAAGATFIPCSGVNPNFDFDKAHEYKYGLYDGIYLIGGLGGTYTSAKLNDESNGIRAYTMQFAGGGISFYNKFLGDANYRSVRLVRDLN